MTASIRTLARHLAWPGLFAAVVLIGAPAGALAQATYPDKPVKFVINFPPAGPLDILARALAASLQADLKQPFIADNRPGAGGNIGADLVAKSPADGYTVLLTIDTPFTINPHLYATMPFGTKDLKPLMIFSSSGLTVATAPTLAVKTFPEFLARAKAQDTTFSSAGNGSPGHFAAEIFASTTGAKVTHIPYKGNAPAVLALLSNEVQAAIIATPGLLPHIQSGKLKPQAVTGRQRSPLLPDVPTVGELGLKNLEFEVLYMAMVPAATPEAVADRLRASLTTALNAPELKARLAGLDMVPHGEDGKAAATHLEASKTRYGAIVKATGMKAD